MPRLFVALPLPADLREEIDGLVDRWPAVLAFGVRRVEPRNFHVTLRFLGEVATVDVERILPALSRAAEGAEACRLSLLGFGAFPNWREVRSVVIGLEDIGGRTADLKRRLDEELARTGFPREERPFKPHITVGRSRRAFRAEPPPMSPRLETTVKEFCLYESELRPEGARYRVLKVYPLGGGRGVEKGVNPGGGSRSGPPRDQGGRRSGKGA